MSRYVNVDLIGRFLFLFLQSQDIVSLSGKLQVVILKDLFNYLIIAQV